MNSVIRSILIVFLLSGSLLASDMLATPLAVFAATFTKVAPHFERAKIQTTWGGFYLRADTQHHFSTSEFDPSPSGLWLGVRILPVKDLENATVTGPPCAYTVKVVGLGFPSSEGEDSGLVITLRYGSECDPKVVSELLKAIEVMKSQAQPAGAGQPATAPAQNAK